MTWKNNDNAVFYAKTPTKIHKRYASIGGLANYSDLKLIQSHILQARSILEVGAGYGRVIEYLLKKGVPGKIYAMERCQKYCAILQKKFLNKIEIFNIDLFNFNIEIKFDLILWLWSGITDFSKSEQPIAMNIIAKHLNRRGTFVIDTIAHAVKPSNVKVLKSRCYVAQVGKYVLHGYIPSPKTILKYGEKLGFAEIRQLPYLTSSNRPRSMYILSM
jgi:SAM-dependent methyltransferase